MNLIIHSLSHLIGMGKLIVEKYFFNYLFRDFPQGSVVKTSPPSAEGVDQSLARKLKSYVPCSQNTKRKAEAMLLQIQ